MPPSGTTETVSRRRKLLYGAIVAILVYGAMEIGAATTFFLLTSRPFSFSEIHQRREALLENAGSSPGSPSIGGEAEVIHPYLGYVMNPEVNSPRLLSELRLPISDFGFIDDTLPIQKKRDDTVIIGVFGGPWPTGSPSWGSAPCSPSWSSPQRSPGSESRWSG